MTDARSVDMALRYGGRVLVLHAFVNTDREYRDLGAQIVGAARGATADAFGCQIEGYYLDGQSVMRDASAIDRDPLWSSLDSVSIDRAGDFPLAYDGKIFVYRVYLNTEVDPYDARRAVRRVARGPRLDAFVLVSGVASGDVGAALWRTVQDVVVASASPTRSTRPSGSRPE